MWDGRLFSAALLAPSLLANTLDTPDMAAASMVMISRPLWQRQIDHCADAA